MHKISSKLIVNKGNFANIFLFAVISSSSTQSYSEVQAVACKIVNGSFLHEHFLEVDAHAPKEIIFRSKDWKYDGWDI